MWKKTIFKYCSFLHNSSLVGGKRHCSPQTGINHKTHSHKDVLQLKFHPIMQTLKLADWITYMCFLVKPGSWNQDGI